MKDVSIDKSVRNKIAMLGNKLQTYDDVVKEIINFISDKDLNIDVEKTKIVDRTIIQLSEDTLDMLNKFGKIGSSYNDILTAIVNKYIEAINDEH